MCKTKADVEIIKYETVMDIPGVTCDDERILAKAYLDNNNQCVAIQRFSETHNALILPIITDTERLQHWQGTVDFRLRAGW